MFKLPQNDGKYQWTNHVKDKMVYYRISESLIKRIVRFPKRIENGVAPGTIAAMWPAGSKKRPQEVWVMYQTIGSGKLEVGSGRRDLVMNLNRPKLRIISAWRYPGISPIGKPIPIPDDILQELDILVD